MLRAIAGLFSQTFFNHSILLNNLSRASCIYLYMAEHLKHFFNYIQLRYNLTQQLLHIECIYHPHFVGSLLVSYFLSKLENEFKIPHV